MTDTPPAPALARYLIDAREGKRFTFPLDTDPAIIADMLYAGYITHAHPDDPYYVPGLFVFTDAGARARRMIRHDITIVPSPKMDAPGLVAALCSCGKYRSGPTTQNEALKRGAAHCASKENARP